jgi:hypothetical protein
LILFLSKILIIVFRQANEQTSDFIDTHTSNDQNEFASFLNNNNNKTTEQILLSSPSIPMTTILPPRTETRAEIWISRLPKTSSVTEADYESQV